MHTDGTEARIEKTGAELRELLVRAVGASAAGKPMTGAEIGAAFDRVAAPRARHCFWLEASAEAFAAWLERETADWGLDLDSAPGGCYLEPFRRVGSLDGLASRWGLRGADGRSGPQPAAGHGVLLFELRPAGRRLRVEFADHLPSAPPPADEALRAAKYLVLLRLEALFDELVQAWPEAREQLHPEAARPRGPLSSAALRQARVRDLFELGLDDEQIALVVGASKSTVCRDRDELGLRRRKDPA